MLFPQLLLFLRVPELRFSGFGGIGSRFLANAAAAHENLGLQKEFPFTRLALHVIDRVAVLDVGIEAENHKDWVIESLSDLVIEEPDLPAIPRSIFNRSITESHNRKISAASLDTVECKPIP